MFEDGTKMVMARNNRMSSSTSRWKHMAIM